MSDPDEKKKSQSWLFTKATWNGERSFFVENGQGSQVTLEIKGSVRKKNSFAPVEAFIASLSSCAGINVIFLLDEKGVIPDSCTVKAECLLNHQIPRIIEMIHLAFLFTGPVPDVMAGQAITEAMTMICPIAVTVGKATLVTWEYAVTGNYPD